MSTPHIEANFGDIAENVIMPGDPLRAKYIAESYLEDYKQVNSARGMFAYTGYYKGKRLTVMAHGMGMPSMGIYCHELYSFYGVQNIIRIGSCGAYDPQLKLFDVILSTSCYSEGNFALTYNNENCHLVEPNKFLNNKLEHTAQKLNMNLFKGTTACTDCFDLYMHEPSKFFDRMPKDLNIIAAEMEAFALFYTAKVLGKNAACLMSVVDLNFDKSAKKASSEEREKSLNDMIKLALECAIEL